MIDRATVFLFDLDGTLVDSRRDIQGSVNYVLSRWGRPALSLAEVAGLVGDGVGRLMARALGDHCPETVRDALDLFVPHYFDHCVDSTTLYPGVLDTLKSLGTRPMAVVTNKPLAHTQKTLKRLGLDDFFGAVLGGDSLPQRKPAPDPLWRAWEDLNGRQGSAWMVGDSPVDMRAGRAAGARVAAATWGYCPGEVLRAESPDVTLTSMRELPEAVHRHSIA